MRSHDPEEAIRHDVIVTIINAGKKDLNLVNDQLLGFVRERTLDKRVKQILLQYCDVLYMDNKCTYYIRYLCNTFLCMYV